MSEEHKSAEEVHQRQDLTCERHMQEKLPFLGGNDHDATTEKPVTAPRSPRKRPWLILGVSLGNLSILVLNILLMINTLHIQAQRRSCFNTPGSTADRVVRCVQRPYSETAGGMYAGESRPELEDAWDDLMRAEVFRATAEDLSLDDEAVNDAVTLEHGGYLASLSVYHALHCIEWIKRNYARAHTIDELHGKEGHLDHCLYFIRESVTCRADVTINSFHWGEDSDVPLSLPGKERPCVDLAAVREWILERALKPGERAVHTNGSLGAPHNKYRFEMPEG